ncbi:MAG: hypothetical protein VYE81_12015 [Planctomycetota bacterium]|nr:hypothetical protein [Planctomycetota bacterium]
MHGLRGDDDGHGDFGGQAAVNGIELIAELESGAPPAPVKPAKRFPHLTLIARVEGQDKLF